MATKYYFLITIIEKAQDVAPPKYRYTASQTSIFPIQAQDIAPQRHPKNLAPPIKTRILPP